YKKHKPRDAGLISKTLQNESPTAKTTSLLSKKNIFIAAVLAGSIIVATGSIIFAAGLIYGPVLPSWNGAASGRGGNFAGRLSFVGSETCAGCHQPEAELWRESQHKHAMDHATKDTILGDFSDASFDYYGVHSRFFTREG